MLRSPDRPSATAAPDPDAVSAVAYVLGMLTDEDVDWLARAGTRRALAAGEVLVAAGDPVPSLQLVVAGELEAVPADTTRPAARRLPGDVVGVVAILDGGLAPATVTALVPSVVFAVGDGELATKLELDLGFAARLYRALAVIVAGRRRAVRAGAGDGERTALDRPHGAAVNAFLAEDRMRRLLRRVEPSEHVVLTGADLTVEQVARVAWERAPVALSDAARGRVEAARAVVERLVAGEEPIYGLTTNLGELKDQRIDDADQPRFQRHILLSHAAGVGPDHSSDVVRAIMLARLNGMARGASGVQPAVLDTLLAMLGAGVHPVVPSRGSIGMSDLAPLAHVALPLIGEGEAEHEGRRMPAADALRAAGIEPPPLAAKDGLALVSANSASVGHGALVIARAIDLLALADIAAALSLEALGGHARALDRHVDTARRFSGQLVSASRMRALLEGSSLWTEQPVKGVQDPISFRSASQVHGAVVDVVDIVRSTLETELNSTGDNPMVLIDRGEMISDGNFHPAGLSIAFDSLRVALAQLTSMAANRIVRLMDPHFTGLATYLTAKPGLNVGLGVLQKTATALNAEVRMAANPASLDYVPVAGAIEDHATMAVEGVAQAAGAVDAALTLLAIELLVACQAIDLRGGHRLGAGTGAAHATVRGCGCAPIADDRLMAREIALARGLLDDGSLLAAVGAAIDRPLGLGVVPGAPAPG